MCVRETEAVLGRAPRLGIHPRAHATVRLVQTELPPELVAAGV